MNAEEFLRMQKQVVENTTILSMLKPVIVELKDSTKELTQEVHEHNILLVETRDRARSNSHRIQDLEHGKRGEVNNRFRTLTIVIACLLGAGQIVIAIVK